MKWWKTPGWGWGVECLAMGLALAVQGLVESGERMVGAAVGLPLISLEYRVFPSFFFLSDWATKALFCPLSVQSKILPMQDLHY